VKGTNAAELKEFSDEHLAIYVFYKRIDYREMESLEEIRKLNREELIQQAIQYVNMEESVLSWDETMIFLESEDIDKIDEISYTDIKSHLRNWYKYKEEEDMLVSLIQIMLAMRF